MKILLKKRWQIILNISIMIISISILLYSYRNYLEVKQMLDSKSFEDSFSIKKVENLDIYEEYEVEGYTESNSIKKYKIDLSEFALSSNLYIGKTINKNENIANSKNYLSVIKSEILGVITAFEYDESGLNCTIIIKDVYDIKACFYINQEISEYYEVGKNVNVKYNNVNLTGTVKNISSEFSEKENLDGTYSKKLFIEVNLDTSDGILLNATLFLTDNICIGENLKTVEKSVIMYDGEEPYVVKLIGEKEEKINIQLGKSNEKYVEIISEDINVGDSVRSE